MVSTYLLPLEINVFKNSKKGSDYDGDKKDSK
jgi:hypothetical protein